MRSDATAHADRTALRAVRRLPANISSGTPSRGERRCSGQPYRMQLTLGARRTAGRRQAADLAPGLPAEQVQPPPIKLHRNGRSALQATVPSGRLQARRIGDKEPGEPALPITLSDCGGSQRQPALACPDDR